MLLYVFNFVNIIESCNIVYYVVIVVFYSVNG